MAELHRFAHEAMATTFEILIASDDTVAESAEYARQAAQAAFHEIDRLEKDLSRFIESSDISRINKLGSREPVRVSIDTFECLQLAARIHNDTGGAFDVTIGALVACWRTAGGSPRRPSAKEIAEAKARTGMERVVLDAKNFTVRLKTDGVSLDLGGIGKGFALDKAAGTLREWADEGWGFEAALLSGGGSSLLAMGAPPGKRGWTVTVGGDVLDAPEEILLCDRALSGSGTRVRGRHIIDPRTGRPAGGPVRAWASSLSGAVSDALSTAFMIMSSAEVEHYCTEHADTWAMLLIQDSAGRRLKRFGKR
jgi:thiamine biosynthesis lipoprotein